MLAPLRGRDEAEGDRSRSMADDAARVEQLETELRRVRDLHAVEVATLRHDLAQRDGALAEALEQQAATAEVLRVIAASPGQALRTTLVELQVRAKRLLDAAGGSIFRVDGDILRRVTSHEAGETDDAWTERPLDRRAISGRAVLDRCVQHIHDVTDPSEAGDVLPESQALRARTGARTFLAAPLLRGDVAIGAIFVVRNEVRPFTDREIALLETFAAQAVVAMENARLFQDLQESNRQITEALEQQTATAEVLRVIASTPTDLDRVLQSITETAARLCEAPSGALLHYRERDQHLAPRAGVG